MKNSYNFEYVSTKNDIQIITQPEESRGDFCYDNGQIEINSVSCPEFSNSTEIYIRGSNRSCDNEKIIFSRRTSMSRESLKTIFNAFIESQKQMQKQYK